MLLEPCRRLVEGAANFLTAFRDPGSRTYPERASICGRSVKRCHASTTTAVISRAERADRIAADREESDRVADGQSRKSHARGAGTSWDDGHRAIRSLGRASGREDRASLLLALRRTC